MTTLESGLLASLNVDVNHLGYDQNGEMSESLGIIYDIYETKSGFRNNFDTVDLLQFFYECFDLILDKYFMICFRDNLDAVQHFETLSGEESRNSTIFCRHICNPIGELNSNHFYYLRPLVGFVIREVCHDIFNEYRDHNI